MDITEAIQIVSYKTALKLGDEALADAFLCPESIRQATRDSAAGTTRSIDAKSYLLASKLVRAERVERYKTDNEQFLAQNSQLAGITTTPSGLQFRTLTEGSGTHPQASDTVEVNYHGTLIDGTCFDSSIHRGGPSSFSLEKVIKGWREGVTLMRQGGKSTLFIPHHLAYSDRGIEGKIPPYSTLIIEVELLQSPASADKSRK